MVLSGQVLLHYFEHGGFHIVTIYDETFGELFGQGGKVGITESREEKIRAM